MSDGDPWPEWISQNQKALAEGSYGHELAFVERVLRHVPEIDPSWVTHEFPFQDANGRNRRVDFVLQHRSLNRPIAIEIDGRNKTGEPPSKSEHDDFFERQNALVALNFRLLRFTNAQVSQNPMKLRTQISDAIAVEQLAAHRQRATQETSGSRAIASEADGDYQAAPSAMPPAPPVPPAPPPGNAAQSVGHDSTAGAQAAKPTTGVVLIGVAVIVGLVVIVAMFMSGTSPEASPSGGTELGVEPPEPFTCPSTAPIKGNESATSGELIYHVPEGQFYDETNPVRCFASEEEAEDAGFRASQR